MNVARLALSSLVLCATLSAGELTVAVSRVDSDRSRVEITVSWANSWYDDRNHDAVWILLRSGSGPLRLALQGHEILESGVAGRIVPSEDQVGAWIEPAAPHRGPVTYRVSLRLADMPSPLDPETVQVWAVEMVYVPAGPFELGDDDRRVVAQGSFFRADGEGRPAGTYPVESEAAIPVGRGRDQLWYLRGRYPQYVGDGQGPIPADYPKGTRAFYVMKYELRQGQYARFLNALPENAQAARANHDLEEEEAGTSSISLQEDGFVAAAPARPCNFVSWDDTAAWADWMGLRPMTELEFEKAARGPLRPVPGDFPWGTASREGVERIVQRSRDLAAAGAEDEAGLRRDEESTRVRVAASYYWVMDLAGSVWERVVSGGNPAGRAFRGTHGDGVLSPEGGATNQDWPRSHADGQDAEGVGYRGGAEYFGGEPNVTNPFSCVGTRQYGAWSGAFRYKTYSARAMRTAPGR